MQEKIKTVLLFMLIGLSLLLSGRLWLGTDQYEIADDPVSQKIDFGEAPAVFEQITPGEIFFQKHKLDGDENNYEGEIFSEVFAWCEGEKNHKYFWNALKKELIMAIEKEELYVENQLQNQSFQSSKLGENSYGKLVYEFSFFPLKFNERMPGTKIATGEELDNYISPGKLIIYLDDRAKIKGIYLADLSGKKELIFDYEKDFIVENLKKEGIDLIDYIEDNEAHQENVIKISNEDLKAMADLQNVISGLDEKIVDKIDDSKKLEDMITLKTDRISNSLIISDISILGKKEVFYEKVNKEKLAKAFFHDLSFVRTIEEWDGAQFYTDGQKGLRFFPEGGLEYSAPYKESTLRDDLIKEKSLLEIITRGGELISLYGGWDEALNLKGLKMLTYGYGIEDFTYELAYEYNYQGYSIINEPALTINFNFQELIDYERKIPRNIELSENIDIDEEKKLQEIIEEWLEDKIGEKIKGEFNEKEESGEQELNDEVVITIKNIKKAFYLKEVAGQDYDLLTSVIVIEDKEGKKYVYDFYETAFLETI